MSHVGSIIRNVVEQNDESKFAYMTDVVLRKLIDNQLHLDLAALEDVLDGTELTDGQIHDVLVRVAISTISMMLLMSTDRELLRRSYQSHLAQCGVAPLDRLHRMESRPPHTRSYGFHD